MPRYHERIHKMIEEEYWPLIDGERDPDVLWVGPFLDGIAKFCPERFNSSGQNPGRYMVKSFAEDIVQGRDNSVAHQIYSSMKFRRHGLGELQFTGAFLINQEPGEVTNSVIIESTPDGVRVIDPTTDEDASPTIRTYEKYPLHFLKVGDEIELEWQTQRGQHGLLLYRLRPLHEGTSLVTQETPDQEVTVL